MSTSLASVTKKIEQFFPRKKGYSFFVRKTESQSVTCELYAEKNITKHEDSCSFLVEIVNKVGQSATLSLSTDALPDISASLESLTDLPFLGQKTFSVEPVASKNWKPKSPSALDTEDAVQKRYSTTLKKVQKLLSEAEKKEGVVFGLESFSFGQGASKEEFFATTGGKCSETFPVQTFCSGEINALYQGQRDETSFSYSAITWDEKRFLAEVEQAIREASSAVKKEEKPLVSIRGNVRFEAKLFMSLLEELESHISLREAKEGMSLAVAKTGKPKVTFSKLLSVDLVCSGGTAFDRHLSGRGRLIEDKNWIKNGKIQALIADTADLQKYQWPEKNACVGQPVTQVHGWTKALVDADTDFVVTNLNALHNLNSQTLDINLTGSGYILKKGKRTFSSNLVLKANLLDIFQNIVQLDTTIQKLHDWSCPDVLVHIK